MRWLNLDAVEKVLQPELIFIIALLSLACFAFYKVFLKELSLERHKNLKSRYKTLAKQLVFFCVTQVLFFVLIKAELSILKNLLPWLGLIAIASGAAAFVQACRIGLLQYLFLTSMRAGVPLLLVNIFSLLLILLLLSWLLTALFSIRLAPLLATSAAFSIILGLALQDTLGNLFAGISLQLDQSFAIGNWVEVNGGGVKAVGQVQEITWRATILNGFADEVITLPNRLVAQATVTNWTRDGGKEPILRSQVFRIPFGYDIAKIKQILFNAALKVEGLSSKYRPIILVADTAESWMAFKVVFFFHDYGQQYLLFDKIIESCVNELTRHQIPLARMELKILDSEANKPKV